jgi:hypothetical protein
MTTTFIPTLDLARKLIAEQFPEYDSLPIVDAGSQKRIIDEVING